MRRIVVVLLLLGLGMIVGAGALRGHAAPETPLQRLKATLAKRHVPSVDHAKFAALQQPFAPPAGCHHGLPLVPHRARARGHGVVALELVAPGVRARPRDPDNRQEERPQQLLHRRGRQPGGLRQVPRRLRVGRLVASTSATSGTSTAWLPRQHRHVRADGRRAAGARRQPERRGPACRPPSAHQLRHLPLLRRRRQQRQARRPRAGALRAGARPRRAHGDRRREPSVRGLPHAPRTTACWASSTRCPR